MWGQALTLGEKVWGEVGVLTQSCSVRLRSGVYDEHLIPSTPTLTLTCLHRTCFVNKGVYLNNAWPFEREVKGNYNATIYKDILYDSVL